MRLAAALLTLVLAAVLAGGCGGSSSGESSTGGDSEPQAGTSTAPAGASARRCEAGKSGVARLRATGVTCEQARRLTVTWSKAGDCGPPRGASRSGCSVLSYRCQATATGRGWSVSCAKPGRSIAFTVREPEPS
jgi:hypothetical protein